MKRALYILLTGLVLLSSNKAWGQKEKVSLALLLPFEVTDSTANSNYLNFYFGALLASKELARTDSLEIELNIVDVSPTESLEQISSALGESDIIIGPVGKADISRCFTVLPDNKYIISPLDSRTESLCQDNRVILASTPASYQIADAVQWLKEDILFTKDSLILVRESDYKVTNTELSIIQQVNNIQQEDSTFLSRIVKIDYSLSKGLEIGEWFNSHTHLKDTLTRVMVASEHDIFVSDVIRNIYLQNSLKKNAYIYGTAKTKSKELEEMCEARLRQSLTFYVDYTDPKVINFVKDFRALYQCEPDNFAFHGYDTAKYFLSIYAKYGEYWPQFLEEYTQSGLQIYFNFKCPEYWEGAINTGLRRVSYSSNYQISVSNR